VGDIFRIIFYQPVFNILVFFYRLLGDNLGLAIIALALFSRIITYPMTKAQLNQAKKSQEFQKEFNKIKKKYGKNKEKMNQELAKVQGKYLPGQIGGCLPMIIMLLFLIQVRNVIRDLTEVGIQAFNDIAYPFMSKFAEGETVNINFLGMDLSKVATDFAWSDSKIIPYVLLAVLVGATQLFSTWIMTGFRKKDKKKEEEKKKKKTKKKKAEEPDMSEFANILNKQMMFLFPIMTVVTSLGYWGGSSFFPSGISVFWTIQSLFVIMAQFFMNRKKIINWINIKILKKEIKDERQKNSGKSTESDKGAVKTARNKSRN